MLITRTRSIYAFVMFAALAPIALTQEIVGSYAKADVAGLQAALNRAPDNVGLRLRLAQALLLETQSETRNSKKMAGRLDEVQQHFKKILELEPNSIIPLRALARDAYYSKRFDESITLGRRLLAIEPTDMVVATDIVKALIQTGHEDESASTMIGWFRTGNMPAFGATQGLLSVFAANPKVKAGLETGFKKLLEEAPAHVLARLAYSAFLSEIGSYDDAWHEFHEAEKNGLCDASNGGRHPFATMLGKLKTEPEFPGAFTGNDVAELTKQVALYPDHVGLKGRLARRLELPLTARDASKDPKDRRPYTDEDKQQLEKAATIYQLATEKNPLCWQPLARAAEIYVEMGRPADAVPLIAKAMSLASPKYIPGHMTASRAMFKSGKAAEAATEFTAYAQEVEPGRLTDSFLDDLCPGTDKSPLLPFADALQKAAEAAPRNPYLWAHLANVRVTMNDKAKAQVAAVAAERAGLAGVRGWPYQTMMDAFGIKPQSKSEAEPASAK